MKGLKEMLIEKNINEMGLDNLFDETIPAEIQMSLLRAKNKQNILNDEDYLTGAKTMFDIIRKYHYLNVHESTNIKK